MGISTPPSLAILVVTAHLTPWASSSAFVPGQVSPFLWLRTFSAGMLWPLLEQVEVSPGSLRKAVFQVILSSKCFRNNERCIFPELFFSNDKLKFLHEETWVTSSQIYLWYLHGTFNKILAC